MSGNSPPRSLIVAAVAIALDGVASVLAALASVFGHFVLRQPFLVEGDYTAARVAHTWPGSEPPRKSDENNNVQSWSIARQRLRTARRRDTSTAAALMWCIARWR